MSRFYTLGNVLKHIALVVCCICIHITVFAQNSTLTGKIVDKESNLPIKDVVITLDKCDLWAISNKDGVFTLRDIPNGNYKLFFSYIGYKDEGIEVYISEGLRDICIELSKNSLALKEIIVSPQENRGIYTSSIINEMTIGHIQASSLEDVMQLLPGNVSSNPSLNNPNFLSIREVVKDKRTPDPALTLGTAVVVDDMQLSNDANLQFLTSSNYLISDIYPNSVAKGVDAREIPSSNIESVEVIRGIASAAYGDMTSGVVIVKTKAGVTPLSVMMKTDAYTKQVAVGQGISLSEKGVINYDVDYTNYYKDLRTDSKSYKRISSQLKFSNTYFKETNPLTFNVKLNLCYSADNNKSDEDAIGREKYVFNSTKLGLNIFGKGILNKSWISEFNYSINTNYSHSKTELVNLENLNGYSRAAVSSLQSGESLVEKLPNEYYSNLFIDGKPLYVNAKLSASIMAKYNKVYNNIIYGAEWKSVGNVGKGRKCDYSRTYNPKVTNAVRQRDFRDIPFLHTYSFFVEDKISIVSEYMSLAVQAGLRLNNLIASQGIDKDYKYTFEPRLNVEYEMYNTISLRAGYGINYKNPTLIHLYPDNVYFDKTSFDNKDVFLATTNVISDVENNKLKPTKNTKKELGLTFKKNGFKLSVTAFTENLRDAISFFSSYDVMRYNRYYTNNNIDKVEYINSQLVQNGKDLEYRVIQDFNEYTAPNNSYSYKKSGIEYTIDCGKFKLFNTSLIVDGAYFYNRRINEKPYFAISQLNSKRDYIGLYPAGGGIDSERLNSTFRLITHLPQLRLVFTCSAQVIWMETYQLTFDSEDVVFGDENIKINPIAYLNKDGKVNEITASNLESPEFKRLIITKDIDRYRKESYPVSTQFNLKLTKELGRRTKVSFYVNNIFNYIQRVRLDYLDSYIYRNQPMFFGAMLKMKF